MNESASQTVAQQLRRMIITGELPSGSLLSEARLSELLGCSRTPLREALQQLRHQYLIAAPPGRGVLVPELGLVDFQQLFEALLYMGDAWIELAAQRIDDQQLEQIHHILEQQERCNSEGRFYELAELDYEIHTLIAEATRNRYLADSARRLHSALARFTYAAYGAVDSAHMSIGEHHKMAEALVMKDVALARDRQREHISGGRRRILKILGLGDHSEPL
jgi:DNA-binding GntR family transcriptional regulator